MLYICTKFREIISNGIKVMDRTSMFNCWRTDGRTDGRTDTQKFGGYNIIPRHFLWRGIKTPKKQATKIKSEKNMFHSNNIRLRIQRIEGKQCRLRWGRSLWSAVYSGCKFKIFIFGTHVHINVNSLTTKKQTTKFSSAKFQKMISPRYIILRIQWLKGKQCRSRWGGSWWAISSRSTLFANSAIFVSGS